MWNFDKIQRKFLITLRGSRCGLMWNFDKIQLNMITNKSSDVVV